MRRAALWTLIGCLATSMGLLSCSKSESDYERGCVDLQDNDGDGLTDCPDPDCTPAPDCETYRLVQLIEEKQTALVELRTSYQSSFAQLYKEYGGGLLASNLLSELEKSTEEEPAKGAANGEKEAASLAANLVTNPDYMVFEQRCLELGSGQEMTLLIDPRAVEFLGRDSTRTACKGIAAAARSIEREEQTISELELRRVSLQ